MLFCDYYKKIKKAMGDAEFKKLPPDKGTKYQKIFMLMTLSVNDNSSGDYFRTYTDLLINLKKTFIKLKNDLENLKDSLQELKKEEKSLDKGEESLYSLKDRIIFSSIIKDILSLPSGPTKANAKPSQTSLNNVILKNIFKAIHKDIFKAINEVGLDKITDESLKQLLKSEFHKACSDKNHMDTHINPHIGTFTDNFINSLNRNRILIASIIPEDNRRVAINIKDNDSSINGLVDVINKDINAIDSSEFNKFVAEVEEEERRAEEARKRVAKEKKEAKEAAKKDAEELISKEKEEAKRVDEEYKTKCKKSDDLFNENDIQMIRRYSKYLEIFLKNSKYLGFSLKNDFPDYSDISYRQIKEYVNYLYFWLNKNKDETFKKYCQGDNISKFAKEITPYLVSRPYFIDVINNLPDDQKKKVYEEFRAEITTVSLDDSLDFLGEELSALLKKIIDEAEWEELWKKEKNNLLEMVFYPMLATLMCPFSYIDPSKEDWNKDWLDDIYKMFRDDMGYHNYLRILEDKKIHIIKGHSYNFLVDLFFFIAEKEGIFSDEIFDYLKLEQIPGNMVQTGIEIVKLPELPKYPPFITDKHKIILLPSPDLSDLMSQSPNGWVKEFFKDTPPIFNDIKHVLDFKNSIDAKDVNVEINVVIYSMLRFSKYYIKNEERILEVVNQSRDFWISKRTSKLFTYIKKELKKEFETYEIQNFQDFKELKKYFLEKDDCPLFRLWSFSFDELVDLHKKN